ncbi:AraC family transcriptional regulator [Burkholderia glumae]|uniref:AraC family transcriptional regulator n=1 Tax=Burkholderia glumae TaxID=337 RepID=A0AAQ0BQM3_BURGL|nr:AraC family transcriptional regulator [Burkholderia glumae]ACR32379.1 Transcriptional regulator, AraC family [Burkholderia glumae BGR1]AJY63670.1 helix-turn-helix domain protein [Burkholderia glumae LMG 2196 = ATCC 33617]MCM2494793.1 AraC family transcriptional regulator [Burkholderia glumae]MCM2545658.1 AraC family transcriptional regulator [Burkholderia glumae]MCM2551480.1 AraC family transcriptional regulator [Burkholderia glumae]
MAHCLAGNRLADAPWFNCGNLLMQSTDLDEVRASVADVLKPHRLTVAGGASALHGRLHHTRWGNLSLNLLDYGSEVIIEPDRLEDFFLLQVPLQGQAEIECGGQRFVSSPSTASLVSPSLALRMRWGEACPQAILRIERSAMERHAQRHFGEAARGPIEFAPEFDLTSPQGQCLMQLLPVLAEIMSTEAHPLRHALAFEQFESTLLNALIYGQPNSARNDKARERRPLAPTCVRRVEEYIRTHLQEPLTIEQLAEFGNVSASTLFAAFKHYHGVTPMAFVRQLRLERVRRDLIGADAMHGTGRPSVTDIALKWGFAHLGRFAMEYKRAFGESPSASLRMRREMR